MGTPAPSGAEARSSYRKRRKAAYMRGFYKERKQRLQKLKADRACERCGFNDPRALTFHHRDPSTKSFPIATYAWKVSWERLVAEIAKCDVLCANCHMIEHN